MNDRGFVLVNVLILVAALSAVAVGLLQVTTRASERLDVAQGAAQAPLILDAGVAFAAQILRQDGLTNQVDHRDEGWALSGFVTETAYGPVRITVIDLERRVNLNRPLALDGEVMQPVIEDLLQTVDDGAEVASALLARYDQLRSGPQTPSNQDADIVFQKGDMTQLAGLSGVSETMNGSGLAALFSTLPRDRGVNVNTADRQVLSSLPGMTPELLAALSAAVPIADEAVLSDVVEQTAPSALELGLADMLETRSHWFEVETATVLNGLSYRGKTVLSRQPGSGDIRVHLHQIEVDG